MEYSTALRRLPEGFEWPEHLQGRLSFDAERQRLTFRGFMTKCNYDELVGLASDLDYRWAIEQLFVLSSEEVGGNAVNRANAPTWTAAIVGTLALVLGWVWSIFHKTPNDTAPLPELSLTNQVESK